MKVISQSIFHRLRRQQFANPYIDPTEFLISTPSLPGDASLDAELSSSDKDKGMLQTRVAYVARVGATPASVAFQPHSRFNMRLSSRRKPFEDLGLA